MSGEKKGENRKKINLNRKQQSQQQKSTIIGVQKNPLEILVGKQVVITSNKSIIFEGRLSGVYESWLILTDAKVRGSRHIAHTKYLLVNKGLIHHIHISPDKLEEISD